MTPLRTIAVPALSDNYIWLLVAGGRALIVDPGESAPVLAALERERCVPAGILLTHHHPDHIAGVAGVLEHYRQLPVIAPQDVRITTATRSVADGDTVVFEAPAVRFEVLAIPGHTSSHIAFHGGGVVCAGDTLFSVGCGRMFEGTAPQMLASLDRLRALPGDTLLCCGHEYTLANCAFALSIDSDNRALRQRADAVRSLRASGEPSVPVTLDLERETNPFLRVDAPAIIETCVRALGPEAAQDRVARFAWLRKQKDQFAG